MSSRLLGYLGRLTDVYSLPFKGRARVGMGSGGDGYSVRHPHPPPSLPLEGGGEQPDHGTACRIVRPTVKASETILELQNSEQSF